MRPIQQVQKRVYVTQIGPGYVRVEGAQITEHVLFNDLGYENPRVGDELIITYQSNGDIRGKWIGRREKVDENRGL